MQGITALTRVQRLWLRAVSRETLTSNVGLSLQVPAIACLYIYSLSTLSIKPRAPTSSLKEM